MKNVLNLFLLITASFTFLACSDGQSKPLQKTTVQNQDHTSHSSKQTLVSNQQLTIQDDQLDAVYEQYTHLTRALINADAAAAKIASNAIEAGASQMNGGKTLVKSASQITSAADLETQRKHYAVLSEEMVRLIKNAGVKGGELFVDYCPMALNDKGAYWLASDKAIHNPYFGEQMLTCGEIKESIKD